MASHSLRRYFFNYLDKMLNAIYHWLDNDIKKNREHSHATLSSL